MIAWICFSYLSHFRQISLHWLRSVLLAGIIDVTKDVYFRGGGLDRRIPNQFLLDQIPALVSRLVLLDVGSDSGIVARCCSYHR